MQLIRADQILGLLADLAVLGRQQLGRNRGIEHILQHIGQLPERAVGFISNQIPHQRLGNRAVDTVHTHVIAVVGRPAERQLGQIARADNHAALLVGKVHQHQCTHTRLTVLKGDGQILLGLTDVRKMLIDRRLDVHGFERNAIGFRQLFGVALGAGGRAEARHGDSEDALAVELEHIKGVHQHDKRQRGIQAAGQTDNRCLGVRMAQTGRQTGRLQRQDLLTAFVTERLVGRNERRARELAVSKVVFRRCQREREYIALDRFKRIHALTLMCQTLKVDIRVNDALLKHSALGKQCAVLGNEVVPCENQILRGLAEAGIRVQVRAQQSAGLLTNEVAAIACLADDFIGSGQVDDNVRAHLRQRSGRRVRDPQVLADLHAEGEQRLLITLKNAVGHDRHITHFARCIGERYALNRAQRLRRHKMTLLVKLGVVRDVCFRHEGQHRTGIDHRRRVVQLAAHTQRQTDHNNGLQLCRFAANSTERLHCALEQGFLQEQIAAGIAGQAQLGERDQLRTFGSGLLCLLDDLGSIIFAVRDV